MKRMHSWFSQFFDGLARWPDLSLRRAVFGAIVLWSAAHFIQQPSQPTLNTQSFDKLLRQRWLSPAADPALLIIDIDEASLAQMAGEFGRWPWPRDTLAALLSWLEQQGARAVVFDILFADADRLNPAADASFADAIAASRRSYFPVLRLNPDNDALSEVRADQLAGFAEPLPPGGQAPPTLAVVPPFLDAAMATRRLGFHNVYPDQDGVLRHYRLWEDRGGWRLWSLPGRLAQDLHWPLPAQASPLINWHAEPMAHARLPFSEVWQLSQSRAGQAPDARFADKIIVIGATATSLFDVKTSPIAAIHPGVELLATAIDNAKNQHFLLQPPRWLEFAITLAALGLMYWASGVLAPAYIKWAILVAPSLLLAIGFASLHKGVWYLDLAGPASQAFVFFALLGSARAKRLSHWARVQRLGNAGWSQAWAVRLTPGLGAPAVFDAVARLPGPLCVQSLAWQRRADRSEPELWLLRSSAATQPALAEQAAHITDQLHGAGPWQQVCAGPVAAFAVAPAPVSLWQRFERLSGKDEAPHPFADADRALVQQALAGATVGG